MKKKLIQCMALLLVLLLMVPLAASAEEGGTSDLGDIFSGIADGTFWSGYPDDPFANYDPFATSDPLATYDPLATPDPFATYDPFATPDPFATYDPFATAEPYPTESQPPVESYPPFYDPFWGSDIFGETPGQVVTPGGDPFGGQSPVVGALGSQLMRIGIYYGSKGKDTVTLSLVTGTGFQFGYYDDVLNFIPLSTADVREITVAARSNVMYVTETYSGMTLFQFDQNSYGRGLGIQPYSNVGEKAVTKCGYRYYGGFRFECFDNYNGTMTIVNIISLDDYLKGVVPYEMSPSWPLEALRVQAVCARSYAMSHISAKHQKNFRFDLCDADCCQVYRGVYSGSYISVVHEAVESTSGVVMMYNGKYCDTVYSSSNGGGSEGSKNVWGKDIPYLQGIIDPYEATIADSIKNYYWSESFTGEELQAKLIASGRVSCGVITEVRTTLSDTGNVIALTFLDNNGKSWTIYNTDSGGSKCRTFLSLRSIHYTVSSESGSQTMKDGQVLVNDSEILDIGNGLAVISGDGTVTTILEGCILTDNGVEELVTNSSGVMNSASGHVFTFSGSGWGHNVGMSQYGALAMANLGFTYREILEFYYTGAMIV